MTQQTQKRITPPVAGGASRRPAAPPPPPPRLAGLGPRLQDNIGDGAVPPSVRELYDLAYQLKGLMLEEIDALDRHDYKLIGPLTERKRVIAGLLKDKERVLAEHPESLREEPEAERRTLAALLDELRKVAHDNEVAVRGAHEGHQRFLNAIIRGATRLEQLGSGYAKNGRMTALTTNFAAKKPVSLFNDTRA